ncbi:Thrombospondin type-1 domain-containing protein 4 [Liparis tanakae]|uniref:Thrombospondin type-1 domain-containing protein 4 n=1 Tax=Liparis tanakae TaxID=230148 RepID=A0A4Z2G6S1_9TELE|nr:Thrombospondin type-1 domain-containing protein 4 [Liparis tanakae]
MRKIPERAEPQQEFRAQQGEVQGSWGAWGTWAPCSRTCGRGVQDQSRPCLPVYTPSLFPSRRAEVYPQQPGLVISALRPTVPLHRDAGRSSNGSSGGDPRAEKESWRPGERRKVTPITPGRYGYGRAPYVAPLQTDTGQGPGAARPHRQRRSAAADAHQLATRGHGGHGGHGGHRPNNRPPTNTLHRHSRPYVRPRAQQPKHNQVWAPLYQPGSANQGQDQQEPHSSGQASGPQQQQERPYDPLPHSFCPGEHAHSRICNMPLDQQCELNCRAVGFRFYVQLSEKVIDGTPCGQNDTSLCVLGKCSCLQQLQIPSWTILLLVTKYLKKTNDIPVNLSSSL